MSSSVRRLIFLPFLLGLLLSIITAPPTLAASRRQDRVPIKDVQVLTLYKGRKTTGSRSSPVQQIKCVGGDACRDVHPEVVQCRQIGMNRGEPQWRCEAELLDLYKLGTTEVSCEGFDYPDDPYILAGSCGLEYTLHRTPKWFEEQEQQRSQNAKGANANSYPRTRSRTSTSTTAPDSISGLIPWIKSLLPFGLGALIPGNAILSWIPGANRFPFSLLFGSMRDSQFYPEDSSREPSSTSAFSMVRALWLTVAGLFTYSVYQTCTRANRPANRGTHRSNGSGGGGGNDGPGYPSPYDDPPPYTSPSSHSSHSSSFFNSNTFLGGLGLGGLLAARSRMNSRPEPRMQDTFRDEQERRRSPRTRPSAPDYAAGSSSSTFDAGSSSSSSDNVRTSVGYGGTKRR
ncbi:Store-operated calcium entry-associated regulatory factor [Thoreauomyces humboldtii]|nr:Store-operated calcium entry-associated regulatory factor [Thoreauomyces humboldtii]